jgi:hypothetical protein
MRAIDIVAADNNDRKLETLLVRVHKHFCCCLTGCIWVRWCQNACLKQIIRIILDLSIDLVCGDVNELLDPHLLRRLQQNVCAIDICVGESVGVSETQVNVRLGCKVEYCVNIVSLQAVHNL